jgi:hypothetical protein
LKYLRYSSGYNELLELTDLYLLSDDQKKMQLLGIKKLVVENFNLNFMILMVSFAALMVISGLVWKKTN